MLSFPAATGPRLRSSLRPANRDRGTHLGSGVRLEPDRSTCLSNQNWRWRLRTGVWHMLETERFQSTQFDGFDAAPLCVVEQQAPAAIHLNPRCTLHLEPVISGHHEFHYQVQVVHFFSPASPALKRDSDLILDRISVFTQTGQRKNRLPAKGVQ